MSYANHPERQRILSQALSARSLIEIDTATRELRQWVTEHPEDPGIVDAFEQLSMMEEIACEQEAMGTPTESQTAIEMPAAAPR